MICHDQKRKWDKESAKDWNHGIHQAKVCVAIWRCHNQSNSRTQTISTYYCFTSKCNIEGRSEDWSCDSFVFLQRFKIAFVFYFVSLRGITSCGGLRWVSSQDYWWASTTNDESKRSSEKWPKGLLQHISHKSFWTPGNLTNAIQVLSEVLISRRIRSARTTGL